MGPPAANTRGPAGTRGLTLLEVLIAAAILSVAVLAGVALTAYSVALAGDARQTAIAAADLESVVESVMGTPFDNIQDAYPDGQPIPELDGAHLPEQQVVVTYPRVEEDRLDVHVTVTWRDRQGDLRKTPMTTAVIIRTR